MSAMNCANCGGPMRSTDAFCGKCGQPTSTAATPAARPASPEHTAPARVIPDDAITVDSTVSDTLDPLFNPRYGKQLLRRFVLYSGVTLIVNVIVLVLDVLLSLIRGSSLLGFVAIFATLSLLVVIVVFWVLPVPALLLDWHRLITFRAPEAARTLDRIQQALDRHHTPYDSLGRKPLTPPGEGRKEYLELRRGFFAGYVSSFAHGDDLYVGMTFWIYVSPIRALIMRLGRKVQDYTGRGNDIYQTLRFESTLATIDALQTCTQEGIEFVTQGPGRPATDAGLPPPDLTQPATPVHPPAQAPVPARAPAAPPPTVRAPSASQP